MIESVRNYCRWIGIGDEDLVVTTDDQTLLYGLGQGIEM